MNRKQGINDIELKGKKILVRVDFNVPLEGGAVRDDTRIRAALPTINALIEAGARIALVSHLGRPKGEIKAELKMDPLAKRLGELLNKPVPKIDSIVGEEVEARVNVMSDGDLVMLENVRFAKEEEKNDPDFARILAKPFDFFVNDAFGTAHRAHASTAGVAAFIPAVAGLLMQKEIEELTRCLEEPGRPLTVIMGGAKVSDKIRVIHRFFDLADNLLVGGGMANTLLIAAGYSLGASFHEEEQLTVAAELVAESKKSRCRLVLPSDLVVTEDLRKNSLNKVLPPEAVKDSWKAVDIGLETVAMFRKVIEQSAMVVWNGPLGVFEVPPYDRGTAEVAGAIAESAAYSVVGGGDLVAALEKLKLSDKINFISTGGGATLEFWEGKELPGIVALMDK
ncbi:MAG: phosphoglycerate kinase [Dethiobacteria bacterium]